MPKLGNINSKIFSALIMLFMIGCGGCKDEKPLKKVELTEETESITPGFMRLDRDLFDSDFSNPDAVSTNLRAKYGDFFCRYIESDLRLADCKSDSVGKLLKLFVSNRDIAETNKEIRKHFSDEKLSGIEDQLTGALRRWNHYFPDSIVPKVIFYQSAWNSNISPTAEAIGVSLDCYLGENNKITKQLSSEAFPAYQKKNMDEKFLVADAAKAWVSYKCKELYNSKDLLSELIFYGKLMYVSEALVPDIPDSTMLSWSSTEWEWAEKHEWNTWKTIANEKVMFQSRAFEISKWFVDGPFTGAENIPQDSPPQLGVWLGWKIVRQYMATNAAITPQQLLAEIDNQKILSAFKPQR